MANSIIQPDDSQTFLLKYSYSGPEFNYNCKEILQIVKNTYPSGNYDTIVLLPYAMYPFGYFIAYLSIGTVNILNLTNNQLTTVGYDQYIAMDYLFDGYMNFESINETGNGLISKGSTPWYSCTESGKDWKYITVTYSDPLVFYTECNYTHMYINGEEYNPQPQPSEVEVKVTYIVPDDEYTYCKLTWKKDFEPESVDDGYSATLLKDESSINVTGLLPGSNYYFAIFTNKSESEPFKFFTGGEPIPPYVVSNLEIMDDFNKEWPIQSASAHTTINAYGNLSANWILNWFTTYLTSEYHYNAIWIYRGHWMSDTDYVSYFVHGTKITIPDDTLRIYSHLKIVPYETENDNWRGCSVFVDSYTSNRTTFGYARYNDGTPHLDGIGILMTDWQLVREVSDPSLPGYTNTIGAYNYVTNHDDKIELAFYTSVQHSHLYVDDNLIY